MLLNCSPLITGSYQIHVFFYNQLSIHLNMYYFFFSFPTLNLQAIKMRGGKNWQLQNLASIYSEISNCLKHSCWKILHMHLRVICLCRCFWSAWVPSDRVPCGQPDQTVDGAKQGWSGGLHKLLPACAQVGSTLTCWLQMVLKMDWHGLAVLAVRSRKRSAWFQWWLILDMHRSLQSGSSPRLFSCSRYWSQQGLLLICVIFTCPDLWKRMSSEMSFHFYVWIERFNKHAYAFNPSFIKRHF